MNIVTQNELTVIVQGPDVGGELEVPVVLLLAARLLHLHLASLQPLANLDIVLWIFLKKFSRIFWYVQLWIKIYLCESDIFYDIFGIFSSSKKIKSRIRPVSKTLYEILLYEILRTIKKCLCLYEHFYHLDHWKKSLDFSIKLTHVTYITW